MSLRLKYYELSKDAFGGVLATKNAVSTSGIDKKLLELVYLRVSQMNGCAYCLQLHAQSLRELGESQKKLDSLPAWRISAHFSDTEQAALSWAEAVTKIIETAAPDEDFNELKKFFNDAQISDLTHAIANINALNRIAISMRS